jgi:hypothetical protein
VRSMCDYSLRHVASRPARMGDKLVSTSFFNSGTRGFAAVDEPNVALCLLPGTELAFEENLKSESAYGFGYKRGAMPTPVRSLLDHLAARDAGTRREALAVGSCRSCRPANAE